MSSTVAVGSLQYVGQMWATNSKMRSRRTRFSLDAYRRKFASARRRVEPFKSGLGRSGESAPFYYWFQPHATGVAFRQRLQ